MPDWLAHVLFAYVLCRVFGYKFKVFDMENTALVIVGALIPDLVKIAVIFELVGLEIWGFIYPLHTPVGSLFLAVLVSLLFYDSFKVSLLLTFGFVTHYMLDFLLMHVSGGMLLFFPLSWNTYQLGLVQADNYSIALILVLMAVVISKMPFRKDL